jgi:hypothetical protein
VEFIAEGLQRHRIESHESDVAESGGELTRAREGPIDTGNCGGDLAAVCGDVGPQPFAATEQPPLPLLDDLSQDVLLLDKGGAAELDDDRAAGPHGTPAHVE